MNGRRRKAKPEACVQGRTGGEPCGPASYGTGQPCKSLKK